MTTARLWVGAGAGRLARRAEGVLFVAGAADEQRWVPIIDGYLDAPGTDDAREVVTTAAIEARFELDPFVMVAWGSSIDLLVLGDIAVRTDLPSVPMLAGAASSTWVEHRVARPPATAQVAAGSAPEPGTRLDAGAVAAGGFALLLANGEAGDTPDAVAWEHVDPEMTIGPPPSGLAEIGPSVAAATLGLVRARRCGRGHANQPHAAHCRVCGAVIGATAPVETIAQPVLGHVVLPDGHAIAVDGTSVLGRRPDTEAARTESTARLVPLDVQAGVSRTHVVIRAEGWTMTATDCASRGRTVLRSPGAEEPEVLEPWVPHELQPGDTLYLGGPTQLQVTGVQRSAPR